MNDAPLAEIHASPLPTFAFPTVTDAWLDMAKNKEIGITFHHLNDASDFWSYAGLLAESKKVAAGLQALGVCRGDRIAIVLPTCPEFILIYFGVLLVEAIPVPLYPPMGLHGLNAYGTRTREMMVKLQPCLLVTMARLKKLLPAIVPHHPEFLGFFEVKELLKEEKDFVVPKPDPEDIALVQFSSGTTASPKPVALSHRNLMANITAIGHRYLEDIPAEPVNLSWLPLYHDMGLIGNMLVPMVWECANVLMPPQDFVARPWKWLQLISTSRATFSSAPNFAYSLCLKRIKEAHMEGVDLSCWHWALNGAEPIDPQTVDAFESYFAKWGMRRGTIIPAYGLAEIALAATIGKAQQGLESRSFQKQALEHHQAIYDEKGHTIASAGDPLLGTSIRIVFVEDEECVLAQGEVGNILIKSDSTMEGYLQSDGTVESKPSDWIQTGDLGFIYGNRLYVCGRNKNLIIRHGRNIYPHELENTMGKVEGVRMGNCLAVSGLVHRTENSGEAVYCFVEVTDHILADKARLTAVETKLRNKLIKEHGIQVDHLILLEKYTLLRTSSGKLRHHDTLKAYLQGNLKTLRKPEYLTTGKLLVQSGLSSVKQLWNMPHASKSNK